MATQLISKEEAATLQLLPFGKKHPVRALLEQLKPGELLQISRTDFNWKGKTPNFFCRQISKTGKQRFKIWKENNHAGWVVERVV